MSKEQPKPRYRIEYIDFKEYIERLRNSPLFPREFDKKHFVKNINDSTIQFISKI